jgi:Cdc6-like AAA superfamily ATPase
MEPVDLKAVHNTLIGFTKRAERATEESLVATFVDSAPLFTLLSTDNNQVIYGRRGTGKTHALKVLAEHVEQKKWDSCFPGHANHRFQWIYLCRLDSFAG